MLKFNFALTIFGALVLVMTSMVGLKGGVLACCAALSLTGISTTIFSVVTGLIIWSQRGGEMCSPEGLVLDRKAIMTDWWWSTNTSVLALGAVAAVWFS